LGKRIGKQFLDADSSPLLSIITVVFNGVDRLEETILSIAPHLNKEVEYIIVDGGSKDGTLDVIRQHEGHIDYWISEPDHGIYDAINKGITASHGHFFYVLNVGDKLLELPWAQLNDAVQRDADVALFKVLLSDGRTIESTIDYRIRFGNTIHHQGAFYSRKLNVQYQLDYKVFSDFNTNQKLFQQKKKFIAYDKVISLHALDGVSNERKYRQEYYRVIRNNFGIFWMLTGILYIKQGELRRAIVNKFRPKKIADNA